MGGNISEGKAELDQIFKIVTEKLNEHEIPWWPEAGSMLGCYREGKRIEWDDEYDIAYPLKYAPDVLEAVMEIPSIFLNWNFYYSVVTGMYYRNHNICLQPHEISREGVYRVATPLRHYLKKLKVGPSANVYGFVLTLILRKLPLKVQKSVVRYNMQTYIRVRFRGTREEYSSWYEAQMGDVKVKLPVGVESILKRHYGEDFMTPKRKEEYTHKDKTVIR